MAKLNDKDFILLQNSLKYLKSTEIGMEESPELKFVEEISNKFILWLEDVDVTLCEEQKMIKKKIEIKSGEYFQNINSIVQNLNRMTFNNVDTNLISTGGKKRRKTFAEDSEVYVANPIIKLENGETREIKMESTEIDVEMVEFCPETEELKFDINLVDQSLEQSRHLYKNKQTFFDIEELPSREEEHKNTFESKSFNEKIETLNVEEEIKKLNEEKLFSNVNSFKINSDTLFSPKLSLIEVNNNINNSSIQNFNFDELNSSKNKAEPNKENSNLEGKSNGDVKSNILKDAQKILYDNDSSIEESPLVVKWNPFREPSEENKIIEKFLTPRFSHNEIYDIKKTDEIKKRVINELIEKSEMKKMLTTNKENKDNTENTENNKIKQVNEIHSKFINQALPNINVKPTFLDFYPQKILTENKFNFQAQSNNFIKPLSKTELSNKELPYEITDESENSSSDEEEVLKSYTKKVKKNIPSWASDPNFLKTKVLSQRQVNHKEIFGNCKINNLDLNIFFSGRKEYDSLRGESADWKDNTLLSITKREEVNDTKRKIDFNDYK